MRVIKNIYLRILSVCLWTLALAACKDDSLGIPDKVVEGKPITVSFSFSAAQEKDIVVTRADNTHSTLHSLAIFVYSGDGSIFQQLVSTSNGNLSVADRDATSDTEGVLYTVSFKTTSGIKKLLAVANTSTTATDGGYWESLSTIATEAQNGNLTFDELKSSVINLRSALYTGREMQPIQITSSDQMLMSGWNESVVFATNGSVTNYGTNVGNKDVVLRLDRSMARITFNIPYKAYTQGQLNKIFTPTSYQVYNVPVNAHLANTGEVPGDEFNFVDFAETNVASVNSGNYSFSFYMPENVYDVVKTDNDGNAITTYHDRDKWNSTDNVGASPTEKSENDLWTFAPQYSTFVVIKGTYEQSGGVDGVDKEYTGNVEYTVHLGDFSHTGSMGNYSVERNCSYTYTVNVLDVNRIVVEAKKEDGNYQEGSEGAIYDYTESDYAYILDAHYEQVYLEYNLSQIATAAQNAVNLAKENEETLTIDQAIANALVLTIQSEAMDNEHEETPEEPYNVHNKQGTLKPYQIYVDGKNKEDVLKNFDYKWVEFWPQIETTIAKYPGVSDWSRDDVDDLINKDVYGGDLPDDDDSQYLMDVYDVIVAMGKVVKIIIENEEKTASEQTPITINGRNDDGIIITNINPNGTPNYVARFTAFVNEYYYYHHPLTGEKITSWSLFTNKMPREMIVAMSTSVSTDGNSSYSVLYSYISQLSIQTFYNSRVTNINGFGIETYNETPLCLWGNPNVKDVTIDDGLTNQWNLLRNNRTDGDHWNWNTYIDQGNNGWTKPLTSEYAAHKLENAYNVKYAYAACMSRNRDLNGNGTIEQNEVRWYLASLNEYIRMSIGAGAISNAAQLYKGDKMAMVFEKYPVQYAQYGSLYYTSSDADQRVFWAVEQGSYSAINQWTGDQYNEKVPKPIRCIRILPAEKNGYDISSVYSHEGVTDEKKLRSDATYEKNGNVLKFKDRLVDALYRERTDGSLDEHTEEDPANSFYEGIVVAENYVEYEDGKNDEFKLGEIVGYSGISYSSPPSDIPYYTYNDPYNDQKLYYWSYNDIEMENPCENYTEGGYSWRVPNLVELSAMNAAGLLEDNTGCCTRFSNIHVRHGFTFATWINCPGPRDDGLTSSVKIRCVRDVPEGDFSNN